MWTLHLKLASWVVWWMLLAQPDTYMIINPQHIKDGFLCSTIRQQNLKNWLWVSCATPPRCAFYGDYELELSPTTYMEALQVYKTLLFLLREKENDAMPVKVWLYPLALLDKKAAILVREIEKTLVLKTEAILEELGNAEILCNDLITKTKLNDIQTDMSDWGWRRFRTC